MADSAAGAGDDTSFAEFSTGDVSETGEGWSGLTPEAYGFSGVDGYPVPVAEGDTEVFDFAESEEGFVRIC